MEDDTVLKLAARIELRKLLATKYSVTFSLDSNLFGEARNVVATIKDSEYLRELFLKKVESDIIGIREGRIV